MFREFTFQSIIFLLMGARWTIALSAVAFLGGGILGFAFALMRVTKFLPVNYLARGYIQFIQGTPLLAQLFVFFFGFSIIGLEVPAFVAASVSLIIFASGYLAEIWRGAIQSVPRPQWEASEALGLGFAQQMRYVILPQAVKIATPATVGFLVQLIKNTSLVAIIGFVELTRAGQITNNATFRPFLVFFSVAAIYFAMCYPLTLWSHRLEKRYSVAGSH